jgi:hypothetical protein
MCGNPETSSAYRSELSSLIAVLFLATKICTRHQIESGKTIIYCDNNGAITNVFHCTYTGISQYLHTDSDLLMAARELLATLPVSVEAKWVKGHSTAQTLSIQEKLNILTNKLTGNYARYPDPKFVPKWMPMARPDFKSDFFTMALMSLQNYIKHSNKLNTPCPSSNISCEKPTGHNKFFNL